MNLGIIRRVFIIQPKYEFQPALDYVKLRQNRAEFSKSKKESSKNVNKHEKIHSAFQSTHWGTAFEDLKVNRLTIKFKIKL